MRTIAESIEDKIKAFNTEKNVYLTKIQNCDAEIDHLLKLSEILKPVLNMPTIDLTFVNLT